ncbi:MAG: hypothetical protein WCX81_01850 [Monoglobales bacterium]
MKTKKIISLVVVLTLVLSFFTIGNVQAAEDEFAILKTLGINTDFSDDTTPITRYQLAEIAVELTKISLDPEGEPTFPDVPQKHKFFPLINAVTKEGLMGALADGSFSPMANASAMDGGRILLAELGYTAFAKQAGWTDAQYNSKVQTLGLTRGVQSAEGLTYYDIGKMMINMLTTKIMEIVSIDAEGIQFRESDRTYIEAKYGYVLRTGVLQANGDASIAGVTPVTSKQAVIDGKIYKTNGYDYSDYVGYNVKYILTSAYADAQLVHVEKYRTSQELVLEAEDIVGYNNLTYQYTDENGATEVVSFPSSARVIINGQNMGTPNNAYFKPDHGKVTLIDTNGDEVYDVVNINTMVYFKVGGTGATTISDLFTSSTIDVKDIQSYIYLGGKTVDIMAIPTGSYVEVAAGSVTYNTVENNVIMAPDIANSDVITINVVDTTTVKGKITTKRGNAVGIDGVIYEFNEYYYDLINSGYVNAVAIGSTATLVLNEKGQVIDIVDIVSPYADSKVEKKYGYMSGISEARGGTGQAVIKIIDFTTLKESGYVTDLDCKVNGKKFKYQDATRINSNSNTNFFTPDGYFKHQLVRYVLDDDGEISQLYLAVDRANEKLINHILPVNEKDATPSTTLGYYSTTDNPDYDPAYLGYDKNNFTLDKEGFLYSRSEIDGLYQVATDTLRVQVYVDMVPGTVKSNGKLPDSAAPGCYDTFPTLQDTRYWKVELPGKAFDKNDSFYINAFYNGEYLQLYDVSEAYVPSVLIEYYADSPKGGSDPITANGFSSGYYNNDLKYGVVIDVKDIFDDVSQEEKRQITVQRPSTMGVETKILLPSGKLKESSLQYKRQPGYTFENDLNFSGSQQTAINWTDIEKGDIIECNFNSIGEVSGFRVIVDHEFIEDIESLVYGKLWGEYWNNDASYTHVNLGYVVKTYGVDGALVNIGGPNGPVSGLKYVGKLNPVPGGNASIVGSGVILHLKSGLCEPATLEDLKVGDSVIYRKVSAATCEIFILRP